MAYLEIRSIFDAFLEAVMNEQQLLSIRAQFGKRTGEEFSSAPVASLVKFGPAFDAL